MGVPGVGKTVIAEGLAQILAAPSFMSSSEEDDGEVPEKEDADRWRARVAPCPPCLKDHRDGIVDVGGGDELSRRF